MSMDLRQVLFTEYRNLTFYALSGVTAAFALRPDATITPVIITLSVLLTYSPFLFRSEPRRGLNIILTGAALAVGGAASRLQASFGALSSAAESVVWLTILSSILSAFSLAALYAGTRFSTRFSSAWSQLIFFPSVWATLWCTVAHLSPVGHLSTWSVADNTDAYNWIIPYLGPASKDWIVGAWAVVISQTVTSWYMGPQESDEDIDLLHLPPHRQKSDNHSTARKLLALFLVGLTIPSVYITNQPLPVSEIQIATPVAVGCAIPPFQRYKHHAATLDDYITESKRMRSMANVILWPEGAVVFHSSAEKEAGFKRIREEVEGPYVGVSFEETISDPSDPSGRKPLSRTGLALLWHRSEEPLMLYYKRHLVPVAESYRLGHSSLPPTVVDLQVFKPEKRGITNPEWSTDKNHSRPLPVSTSICLDFATPSPFSQLESRPALILAPARTWDRTVGYTMWLQAKQRAEELGSMVLWCDGGEGGVSGVGGGGFNDITQVGDGSFVRTIGVQYPFNTHQTPFARFGDSVLALLWVLVLGPGFIFNGNNFKLVHLRRVVNFVRGRRSGPSQIEAPQNLLD